MQLIEAKSDWFLLDLLKDTDEERERNFFLGFLNLQNTTNSKETNIKNTKNVE